MAFDAAVQPLVDKRMAGTVLHTALGVLICFGKLFSSNLVLLSILSAILLVPIVLFRKATIQVSSMVFPNNLQWIYHTFNIRVVVSVLLHFIVAGSIAYFYHSVRHGVYPALLRPKGIYAPPDLNPKYVYMTGVHLVLGPSYALHRYFNQADQLRFPPIQRSPLLWFKSAVAKSIVRGVRLGFIVSFMFWLSFVIIGWPLQYTIAAGIQFWSTILGNTSSVLLICLPNVQLFLRATSTAAYTFVLLEIAHDQFAMHLTSVILNAPNLKLLISSLNENLSPYSKYLLMFQINWAVQFSPVLRQQIFNDVDTVRPAWKSISVALMTRLEELRVAFEDSMVQPSPAMNSSSGTADSQSEKRESELSFPDATQTNQPRSISPAKTGAIYPAPRSSFLRNATTIMLDPLTPGGEIFMTEGRKAELIQGTLMPKAEQEIPTLLRRKPHHNIPHFDEAHISKQAITNFKPALPGSQELINAFAYQAVRLPYGAYILGETVVRRAACITKDIQLNIWTIEEALVSLLMTIEQYLVHFHRDSAGRPLVVGGFWRKQTARSATWIVPQELHICILALQNSIYRIVTTYYAHMTRFEFTPETATRLQQFLDFHE
ncbi:hypothetical protein BSLG_009483 [Batrachochytrium salamandrivorans]|nr:hypothetical protein BSLG_009483 [Batrachochytrium salamandrivorans]